MKSRKKENKFTVLQILFNIDFISNYVTIDSIASPVS